MGWIWLAVTASAGTPAPDAAAFVRAWAADWASGPGGFAAYASRYAEDFRSGDRDRAAWLADKRAKADRALCLDVVVSDVRARPLPDGAVEVTFRQQFTSDHYCDEGEKTLALVPDGAGFRIRSESQPAATACAARCRPLGAENDPIGSFARSCAMRFPEVITVSGSACPDRERLCAQGCADREAEDDAGCIAPCEACRATCTDDACRRRCAEERQDCRSGQAAAYGACRSACERSACAEP